MLRKYNTKRYYDARNCVVFFQHRQNIFSWLRWYYTTQGIHKAIWDLIFCGNLVYRHKKARQNGPVYLLSLPKWLTKTGKVHLPAYSHSALRLEQAYAGVYLGMLG